MSDSSVEKVSNNAKIVLLGLFALVGAVVGVFSYVALESSSAVPEGVAGIFSAAIVGAFTLGGTHTKLVGVLSMWKVYIVYPDGRKRLAGGVKGYRIKDTADAAFGYYEKMVNDGSMTTFRGCRVELAEE